MCISDNVAKLARESSTFGYGPFGKHYQVPTEYHARQEWQNKRARFIALTGITPEQYDRQNGGS